MLKFNSKACICKRRCNNCKLHPIVRDRTVWLILLVLACPFLTIILHLNLYLASHSSTAKAVHCVLIPLAQTPVCSVTQVRDGGGEAKRKKKQQATFASYSTMCLF